MARCRICGQEAYFKEGASQLGSQTCRYSAGPPGLCMGTIWAWEVALVLPCPLLAQQAEPWIHCWLRHFFDFSPWVDQPPHRHRAMRSIQGFGALESPTPTTRTHRCRTNRIESVLPFPPRDRLHSPSAIAWGSRQWGRGWYAGVTRWTLTRSPIYCSGQVLG